MASSAGAVPLPMRVEAVLLPNGLEALEDPDIDSISRIVCTLTSTAAGRVGRGRGGLSEGMRV
eukprot:scaffold28398_cov28-Tisochrysis_lutea.AAC.3